MSVTSTACSGPPVRPAEHAGRGSAPRSSRLQETFSTSVVRWQELKAKFGVGAFSVSRALVKQDDEAPVTS